MYAIQHLIRHKITCVQRFVVKHGKIFGLTWVIFTLFSSQEPHLRSRNVNGCSSPDFKEWQQRLVIVLVCGGYR